MILIFTLSFETIINLIIYHRVHLYNTVLHAMNSTCNVYHTSCHSLSPPDGTDQVVEDHLPGAGAKVASAVPSSSVSSALSAALVPELRTVSPLRAEAL